VTYTIAYFDHEGTEVQRLHSQPSDPFARAKAGGRTVPPVVVCLPEKCPKWLRLESLRAARENLFPGIPAVSVPAKVRTVEVRYHTNTEAGTYRKRYHLEFLTGRPAKFRCPVTGQGQETDVEVISRTPWRDSVWLLVYLDSDLDGLIPPSGLREIGYAAGEQLAIPNSQWVGICPYNVRLAQPRLCRDAVPKPCEFATAAPAPAPATRHRPTRTGRRH